MLSILVILLKPWIFESIHAILVYENINMLFVAFKMRFRL